ncbi:MAG TPA: ferredoxin--NADP reductase [Noviherbaspirillum sp.]|nr:ferredoxin--NADP reductase [Noviherbaspirillum sp.]
MFDDILAKGKSTLETVTSKHWWTDALVTFTTTKPPNYSFVAGQYARLGLPDEHDAVWRAYSMVSAPHEEQLEFYGILVPNGRFTSRLKQLKPGDRILLEKQPFGFMTVDRFEDGDDLWMLATGTGIGPFISILRDPLVWEKFRHLQLVHCVRHAAELSYQNHLAELARRPPTSSAAPARMQLIQSTTRDPEAAPPRLHGRVTTLLENGELERAAGIPLTEKSSRIMLCGNPDMIEDTRRILHHRGMRPCRRALPGQFVTENYW